MRKLGVGIYGVGEGFGGIMGDRKPREVHVQAAARALKFAEDKIRNGDYRLLILDEINVAVHLGLVDVEEMLAFLKNKPKDLDVILTGRDAPKEFIEIADLVSEVKDLKHPFSKGVSAKRGIEF